MHRDRVGRERGPLVRHHRGARARPHARPLRELRHPSSLRSVDCIVVSNRKRAAERVAAVLPLRSHARGGALQREMQQQCS